MNKESFSPGDKLTFSIKNDFPKGAKAHDLYLVTFLPNAQMKYQCIKPDNSFDEENITCPFARNYIPVPGEQKVEVPIPDSWKQGKYHLYLFYVKTNADPLKESNWAYTTFTEFNIVK
jgi:hypothetical protein